MAGYNTIRGLRVKYLSADPAGAEDGQVWYNSTTGNLRVGGILGTAAWSSGGALGTARRQIGGFGHTQTTGVAVCGQNPPALSLTEEYNGSSWSAVTASPIARIKPFANGSLTAGLVGGGEGSPNSLNTAIEYDGTNWAGGTTIPQNAGDATSVGTQTSALLCVGVPSPNTAVLYYDGSSWTAGPAATPARMAGASGCGASQTSAVVFGAAAPTSQTLTLGWDGSSWTSGGDLSSGRNRGASSVGSPATDALYFGGNFPPTTELVATEKYDGTSWSTQPNMATARRGLGGAGTSGSALAFGGYTGSDSSATEEFIQPVGTKNISTS